MIASYDCHGRHVAKILGRGMKQISLLANCKLQQASAHATSYIGTFFYFFLGGRYIVVFPALVRRLEHCIEVC